MKVFHLLLSKKKNDIVLPKTNDNFFIYKIQLYMYQNKTDILKYEKMLFFYPLNSL